MSWADLPPENPPEDDEAAEREIAVYRARYLARHLAERNPLALTTLLENEAFLAEQVEVLGNYAAASQTLLQLALPRARAATFWLYGAAALALQQLATRLDDSASARAILRAGRAEMIAGLAEQLARPLDRARIWALLAAAEPAGPSRERYCRQVIETVDSFLESPFSVLEPEDEDSLDLVLYELALEMAAAWSRWQRSPRLREDLIEELRLDFLEGSWRRGAWLDPFTYTEARRCSRQEELAGRLAHLMVQLGAPALGPLGELLARWRSDDPAVAWRLALAAGSRLPNRQCGLVRAFWRTCLRGDELPPGLLSIEQTHFFWGLAGDDLRPLENFSTVPLDRAVVALGLLLVEPSRQRLEQAKAATEALADPRDRFLSSLMLAIGATAVDRKLARRWIYTLRNSLEESGYQADSRVLGLFLLAYSTIESAKVGLELQEICFAHGFSPANLIDLASRTTDPAIWKAFVEGIERFALAVAESEVAAFALRSRALHLLGLGLDSDGGDLRLLPRLTDRLLLEEEEKLRLELAERLTRAGRLEEARSVIAALPPGAARRLGEIRLMASRSEPLDAATLYTALCDLAPLEDELCGLRALLEAPIELDASFERWLGRIADPDTRSLFVIELVRHRAAFEQACFGRLQDPRLLLEMARPLLAIEDEGRLADLVPELVATGLLGGRKIALAELLESGEGLSRLAGLAPARLLEAFEPWVLAAMRTGDPQLVASFLAALTRLPALFAAEERERSGELRRLVPRVVALIERGAPTKRDGAGWLGRLDPVWRLDEPPWPEVLELCRASPAERVRLLHSGPATPSSELVEAAVFLLVEPAPDAAVAALARLEPAARRESLAARLIRWRWLDPGRAPAVLPFIADESLQRRTLLHANLESADGAFLENLADAVAHGHVDPHDPAERPILRRLWRCRDDGLETVLNGAVRGAFRQGPQAASRALLIWLHGVLAPQPGEAREDRIALWERLAENLRRARSLSFKGEGDGGPAGDA